MIGYIDFFAQNPKTGDTIIFELKAVNEASFDHTLQVLLYDYLVAQQDGQLPDHANRLIVFNALKGIRYEFLIDNREQLHMTFDQIIMKSRPCL